MSRLSEKQRSQNTVSQFDFTSPEHLQQKCNTYNSKAGKLNEIDGYNCDVCNNRGDLWVVSDGEILSRPCDKCPPIRRSIKNLKASGLDKLEFSNFTVSESWQQKLLEMGQKYVSNSSSEGEWIYIGGQNGAGKTHICTAVSRSLTYKFGAEVMYTHWRELIRELHSAMQSGTYSAAINKLRKVKVLYIDDFFKTRRDEKPTDSELKIAFEIIDSRYCSNLVTIISSEFSIDEIVEIDEAIGGRIKQKSKGYCAYIARDRSKDYRLK